MTKTKLVRLNADDIRKIIAGLNNTIYNLNTHPLHRPKSEAEAALQLAYMEQVRKLQKRMERAFKTLEG